MEKLAIEILAYYRNVIQPLQTSRAALPSMTCMTCRSDGNVLYLHCPTCGSCDWATDPNVNMASGHVD